jgi:polyribonucleotide nucleotidyltransferase
MAVVRVEKEIAGRTLVLETGKVAKLAHGAVEVRYGDTVVLATVLSAPPTRDIDYFPLYVDYRENQFSAGKIPGGFFKREGRPSTKEILTMRMIDRPIRPLFPDDFTDEVQIQCPVLSFDQQNDPDILAVIGSSAALSLSHTPFEGPVGVSRICYVDGEYFVNPTHEQLEGSLIDLVVCAHKGGVNMLELGGNEASEEIVAEAIRLGTEACGEVISAIEELVEKVGKAPVTYQPNPIPSDLKALMADTYGPKLREAKLIAGKAERNEAVAAVKQQVLTDLCPEDVEEPKFAPAMVRQALYKIEGKVQRDLIFEGKRSDGRALDEIRPLGVAVGVLPRTHGSALFSRGETQALVTTTLGTTRDEQIIDGLVEYSKKFMLHYNFPPFCVGEIRPIRGPGRRDIGHGALAEKSIEAVLPNADEFAYTIRVVSDILESNGSSSMASVCGTSLSLMDAGVPIKSPVAGISIGMVSDEERHVLLTDIIGQEDFHGDMDFKVAGTTDGITGIQLDMKARCIKQDQIVETLERARVARLQIIEAMRKVIPEPRADISEFAPRMISIQIDPDKIGKVIGSGGSTIKRIQEESGATVEIDDDNSGRVYISSVESEGARIAREAIEALVAEAELDRIYEGKVVSVKDFGAFIEILPGTDGMCHISELSDRRVGKVTDVCNVGDTMRVKVVGVEENRGKKRIRLSRKAVLQEEGKSDPAPAQESAAGGDSSGSKPRDDSRGRSHGRKRD